VSDRHDRDGMASAPAPVIILVGSQLGENIGAAARAMLNCGLDGLRLVRPRDGWPNPRAVPAASGAERVLETATLFGATAAAVADLQRVYATTARNRGMVKPIVTPREAARRIRADAAEGIRSGILFGPERTGLENDDLNRADTLLSIPANPDYASFNLAQAVLLVAYEWFQAADQTPAYHLHTGASRVATKAEIDHLFVHFTEALDHAHFFPTPDQRGAMVRNLRSAIERMQMTEQEVRTFHGIIAALTGRPKARKS